MGEVWEKSLIQTPSLDEKEVLVRFVVLNFSQQILRPY